MPFRYLIGFPLGSWIIRKAIVPSVEVAGNILTGTRTRERRRLPDQTGMGAMAITRKQYSLSRIWGGRWPLQVNKDGTARKLPRNPLMGEGMGPNSTAHPRYPQPLPSGTGVCALLDFTIRFIIRSKQA